MLNSVKHKFFHVSIVKEINFTLFRMGFKICNTYTTMMKLGTVIPYLKKVQKMYESQDTPLELC